MEKSIAIGHESYRFLMFFLERPIRLYLSLSYFVTQG